ncbi:MAG: hypothetical protein KJ046_02800 [Anaerolineae bacterium]|nr:hypothetical protein [Anaerolineae bacterium]
MNNMNPTARRFDETEIREQCLIDLVKCGCLFGQQGLIRVNGTRPCIEPEVCVLADTHQFGVNPADCVTIDIADIKRINRARLQNGLQLRGGDDRIRSEVSDGQRDIVALRGDNLEQFPRCGRTGISNRYRRRQICFSSSGNNGDRCGWRRGNQGRHVIRRDHR